MSKATSAEDIIIFSKISQITSNGETDKHKFKKPFKNFYNRIFKNGSVDYENFRKLLFMWILSILISIAPLIVATAQKVDSTYRLIDIMGMVMGTCDILFIAVVLSATTLIEISYSKNNNKEIKSFVQMALVLLIVLMSSLSILYKVGAGQSYLNIHIFGINVYFLGFVFLLSLAGNLAININQEK